MNESYRILDLTQDASPEEVKDRYRQLVRIFHPDRYPKPEDKAYAEEKLQEINRAYATVQGDASRGLRIGADARPPRPVIQPGEIDFGRVVKGESAIVDLQIDNVGGMAQAMNFHFQEGVDWLAVVKGERLYASKPLPLLLTLEAKTESLNGGQKYESWLDVEMNGSVARAGVTMQVVEETPAGRHVGWLLIGGATAVLLAIVLLLGQNWGRQNSTAVTSAVGSASLAVSASAISTSADPAPTSAADTAKAAATEPDMAVASSSLSGDDADASLEKTEATAEAPRTTSENIGGVPPAAGQVGAEPSDVDPSQVSGDGETSALALANSPTSTATSTTTPRATSTPTRIPTGTPTSIASTPTLAPSPTRSATATLEASIPPTAPTVVESSVDGTPVDSGPADGASVFIAIPQTFQINARAETSVQSAALALLPKGATYPAIARTIDNAWTQIVLDDGRVAWVFTSSVVANIDEIATLPVSQTLLDDTTVVNDPAPTAETVDVAEPEAAAPQATQEQEDVPPEGAQRHRVAAGEFLKELAERYYGDINLWTLIYEANVDVIGPDPNVLYADMELVIPAR